jgi:hypothetical protein
MMIRLGGLLSTAEASAVTSNTIAIDRLAAVANGPRVALLADDPFRQRDLRTEDMLFGHARADGPAVKRVIAITQYHL